MAESRSDRPRKASIAYVSQLLRDHVWAPGLPEDVGLAAIRILIGRGMFERQEDHLELVGHPGATLDFPDDAGRSLYRAVVSLIDADQGVGIFAHFTRGPGATGGGACNGASATNDQQRADLRRSKEAERLEWHRETAVHELGGAQSDSEVVVDHVLSLLRAEPDAARRGTCQPGGSGGSEEGKITVELDVKERKLRWKGEVFPLRSDERVRLLQFLAGRPREWTNSETIDRELLQLSQKVAKRLMQALQDRGPELAGLILSKRNEGYQLSPRFSVLVNDKQSS